MENKKIYEQFLKKLREIREYEWNNYDIRIHGEYIGEEYSQSGVRDGEGALEAIARHMVDVLDEI